MTRLERIVGGGISGFIWQNIGEKTALWWGLPFLSNDGWNATWIGLVTGAVALVATVVVLNFFTEIKN